MPRNFRWLLAGALAAYGVGALAYSRLGVAIDRAIEQILADG